MRGGDSIGGMAMHCIRGQDSMIAMRGRDSMIATGGMVLHTQR